MPPFEEWISWFEYVWKNAFESGEDSKRRYYVFVNYTLGFICYPFGRDKAKRTKISATSSADKETAGETSSGIPAVDLSGTYLI